MNAKEYLSQVMHIDQRINSKLEQVVKLRESATKATATLSDMPRSDSQSMQTMENTICKIVDLEREINADIDALVDLKAQARRVISQLRNPDQQLVLELRYLCYRSWEEIAEVMHMHIRTVYKVHGRALLKVEAILQNADFKKNRKSGS